MPGLRPPNIKIMETAAMINLNKWKNWAYLKVML